MKHVALIRHAKSDWGNSNLEDIDRPLAPRGLEDAPLMGEWLNSQIEADLALVSPALRAQQTWQGLNIDCPSVTENRLYPTQAGNLLRILKTLDDAHENVLIVGHNPGISNAIHTFLNAVSDDPKLEEMPTCACAILSFRQKKWASVDFAQARLVKFMTPKRLKKTV